MSELQPLHWFLLTFLFVLILAFVSMQEMAIVSLNRLDLLYDYAKGSRRAKWIVKLLRNPDQLFATTLLIANLVLQIGSECSRRFYQSMDLTGSFAPFTQVIIVVICGELAPMFTARQYPRQIAFFGIPVIYAVSILLRPLTAIVAWLSDKINQLLGGCTGDFSIVSREDLKFIVRRTPQSQQPESFLEKVGGNILAMHEICAQDILKPLQSCSQISSKASIKELRALFESERPEFVLVQDPDSKRYTGIVLPRFLIDPSIQNLLFVHQIAQPTLHLRSSDSLIKILLPLRQSRHSIAIVSDSLGETIGCLTFDEVALYLFGSQNGFVRPTGSLLEKDFDPETTLGFLRQQWNIELGFSDDWTLEEFLDHHFDRTPEMGEKFEVRGIDFEIVGSVLEGRAVRIRAFVRQIDSSKVKTESVENQPLA